MTVVWPSENWMRLPFTLGCRPSPACMMPAFTSSSLNLPMSESSFSLGMTPASLFFVAFTITMTFMSYSLYSVAAWAPNGCSQGSRSGAGKFDSCQRFYLLKSTDKCSARKSVNTRTLRDG